MRPTRAIINSTHYDVFTCSSKYAVELPQGLSLSCEGLPSNIHALRPDRSTAKRQQL